MTYRSMQWTPLLFAGLLACGGGGGTSESAGATTSASQTTSASAGSSTGPGATTVTSSGSTGAGTGSASDSNATASSGEPTGGGTSTSGSTGATGSGTSSGSSGSETTGTAGTSSTSDTGTTGAMCVEQAGSCAQGQTCCAGLECCAGVPVPQGQEFCGMECPKSDRNLKRSLAPIDAAGVLERLAALDIGTWEYKKDPPNIRHLGPMAQDFKQAFGLGANDTTIFPLDASGVAMAAIQALHAENQALRDRLEQVERRLAAIERAPQR